MYTGIQKCSTTTTTEVRFGVFHAAVSKPFFTGSAKGLRSLGVAQDSATKLVERAPEGCRGMSEGEYPQAERQH